jgi:hypothetical protein
MTFPAGRHDDQADSTAQVSAWANASNRRLVEYLGGFI